MKTYKFIDPVSNQSTPIGELCKRWRIMNNYRLSDVASDLEYSEDNVKKFEQGTNNNMNMLLWYIRHGFDITRFEAILEGGEAL